MSRVHTDDDSSDENGRSMQSNNDAESEDSTYEIKKKKKRNLGSTSKSNKHSVNLKKKDARRKSKAAHASRKGARSKSSNNKSSELKDDVKSEVLSDEFLSAMSDINPPSLSTRLRRKGRPSSTSSAVDSDARKAKSEPILITLDSDSEDDNTSAVVGRPNRSARIQGEMIRKLGLMSHSAVVSSKSGYSSSSSDGEGKKKSHKKKSLKVQALSFKAKKYLSSQLVRQNQLKQRSKAHVLPVYLPLKQTRRLKIQNLQKRFERKKKELLPVIKRPLRKASQKSVPLNETRRFPRRCSSLAMQGAHSVDREAELKVEKPRRKVSSGSFKSCTTEEQEKFNEKKTRDNSDIEEDIRRIVTASKPNAETSCQKDTCKANSEGKNTKGTPDNRLPKITSELKSTDKTSNQDPDNEITEDKVLKIKSDNICSDDIDKKASSDVKNTTVVNETVKEEGNLDEKIANKLAKDTEKEEIDKNIESDLEKIRTNTPDVLPKATFKGKSVGQGKRRICLSSKSKMNKRGANRKKKIMPPMPLNVIRRGRGRPRLSDSCAKHVISSAKSANATSLFQIKAQVPFLQSSFCFDVAPKLSKCRECRIAVYRNSKRMYNSYCRFMEYRKLCYNKNGVILSAGFSNPTDATTEHLNQWLPQPQDPPKDLNCETAKSLLEHIGDQFCDLVEQEKEARSLHIGLHQVMTWKRIVQGVREMCDVCSTTIFNIHWVCPICGFAVCIDCYKVRKQGLVVEDEEDQPKDRDEFKWLLCTLRQSHAQDSLVMAQMIPGKALWTMRDLLHKARVIWNIPSYCKCNPQKVTAPDKLISTGINKQLMSSVSKDFLTERNNFPFKRNVIKNDMSYDDLDIEVSASALKWLDGTCINSDNINNNLKLSDDNLNSYEDFNILGDSLLADVQENGSESDYELNSFSLDDIIASVTNSQDAEKSIVKHFSLRYPQPNSGRDPLPIRIYTKIESELAFSDVPHSWFCNGRLLFLHKANHKDNLALFQEQWKRGQPILVKGVDEGLDMTLWRPEGFCRDFGEVKNDLVDCKTGAVLKNLPMKKFWEGFENFSKRLIDENGEYMLLKLKDWPPGEDFSEKLPTRFEDLMKGLPLPEYTHRNGILNLAGRLPSSFVRPDLGPKMYNAYGSALYPAKGTTNLHLDVSDAVNVMVYVGIPSDGNSQVHVHEALKAIDEGGCDSLMRSRVRNRSTKPGALWHIYNARDADKIRDMLTKVAIERGEKLEAHHDPIHDQSWYIDAELRLRLYRDYGVEGYAIAQCLGDAVFIPAGAPHQVRNLHSCVKVAEDFVSPENIAHCFKLTQEFRNLSDTHTNHEDKLQIKNIIYHVVRDSLSHLLPQDEAIS